MDMDKSLVGKRVEVHPATEHWMRGARYGTVLHASRSSYWLRLDKYARPIRLAHRDLYAVLCDDGDKATIH